MITAVDLNPTPEPGLLAFIDQSPTLSAIVGGLVVVAIVAPLLRVPKLKPIYTTVEQHGEQAAVGGY